MNWTELWQVIVVLSGLALIVWGALRGDVWLAVVGIGGLGVGVAALWRERNVALKDFPAE